MSENLNFELFSCHAIGCEFVLRNGIGHFREDANDEFSFLIGCHSRGNHTVSSRCQFKSRTHLPVNHECLWIGDRRHLAEELWRQRFLVRVSQLTSYNTMTSYIQASLVTLVLCFNYHPATSHTFIMRAINQPISEINRNVLMSHLEHPVANRERFFARRFLLTIIFLHDAHTQCPRVIIVCIIRVLHFYIVLGVRVKRIWTNIKLGSR